MRGEHQPCNQLGEHADGPTRLYPGGWRCKAHAPWALAGEPEPQPGPGWPAHAWTTPSPQSASAVIDARAIASGKRRSSPAEYRAAQAAVAKPAKRTALRVDLGKWDPKGHRWIQYPTADFTCACGASESASGDAVAAFAACIEDDHNKSCPLNDSAKPSIRPPPTPFDPPLHM